MIVPARDAAPKKTAALVRSNNRRGAVAEALALIDDALRRAVGQAGGEVVIRPSISPSTRRATSAGALAALVDAVLAAGGRPTVVLGPGAQDLQRHRVECWGRPVEFVEAEEPGVACVIAATTLARPTPGNRADLVLVEGPIGWSGRRVLAVAGEDADAVAALVAIETGRADSATVDLDSMDLRGDEPTESHLTEPARKPERRAPHILGAGKKRRQSA